MNQYVVLLGPWSSGSSAVAGIMDRLGAYTCPPHHRTLDPRTPTSYEPIQLREILVKHIDENNFLFMGDRLQLAGELKVWIRNTVPPGDNVVAIKHALMGMIIPVVTSVLKPKYVLIRRPLMDIQRTEERRGWGASFGALGARVMYDKMYADLVSDNADFMDLYYPDLLAHPEREIDRLAEYTGVDKDRSKRQAALDWVRR